MTMPILPMDLAQELATHAGLIYCAQDQFVVRFSFTGAAAWLLLAEFATGLTIS